MLQSTKDPYVFEKKEISHIPVYFNHLPWSPCVHIGIGFKVGALDDPEGKDGLAHFLEHVIFNGSTLFPTQKDVREFKKKYTLDTFNARTGLWYTEYTAKCLPEHFSETTTGLFDLLLHPTIDQTETAREKNIIIQELWDRFKNEKRKAYYKEWLEIMRPNLNSKRMWSPGGWPELVQTITIEDLKKWHTENYHAGNMYVLLAGAIQPEHISLVEKLISSVPEGKPTQNITRNIKVQKPTKLTKTRNSDDIGMKQDHATLSIDINTSRNLQNEEVLNLAADLLYTVLFEILREEMGLCYGVQTDCDPEMDYVANYISLNLSADKLDEAEAKIFELIKEIGDGKYVEKFNEEKRLSIDRVKAQERTADMIIGNASNHIIYWGEPYPLSKTIQEREAVTYEETARYITETFKRENVFIERIIP